MAKTHNGVGFSCPSTLLLLKHFQKPNHQVSEIMAIIFMSRCEYRYALYYTYISRLRCKISCILSRYVGINAINVLMKINHGEKCDVKRMYLYQSIHCSKIIIMYRNADDYNFLSVHNKSRLRVILNLILP